MPFEDDVMKKQYDPLPVEKSDHPDVAGGIVWADCELDWIRAYGTRCYNHGNAKGMEAGKLLFDPKVGNGETALEVHGTVFFKDNHQYRSQLRFPIADGAYELVKIENPDMTHPLFHVAGESFECSPSAEVAKLKGQRQASGRRHTECDALTSAAAIAWGWLWHVTTEDDQVKTARHLLGQFLSHDMKRYGIQTAKDEGAQVDVQEIEAAMLRGEF